MEITNTPRIIFDTDMDTDCDDVGAFAMLLEAHLSRKIELIGVVADSVSRYAAPCCEVMAQYYKINVPVGTIYSNDYMDTAADIERFANYRRHSEKCLSLGKSYNYIFAKKIEKIDKDYPSAASVYRRLLSESEDNSVTVLCVGMLTALAEALCSQPDEISQLSGVELFRKKVKSVITMGNPNKTNDFNWCMDAYATEKFFSLCPVHIYISAEGTNILTGEYLSTALMDEHPLKCAYEIWFGQKNCGRSSWDLIATLYAIESETSYLTCKDLGGAFYVAKEKKLYINDFENKNIRQIYLNCEPKTMSELLNKHMLGDFELKTGI